MTNHTHLMDAEKPAEVAVYSFDFWIGGRRFGGSMPAASAEQAKQLIESFGGVLMGRLNEVENQHSCAICGGKIVEEMTHPKPNDEDFPDHIDG